MKKKKNTKKIDTKKTEFDDMFAELKEEYLQTFSEKIEAIGNFWEMRNRDGLQNEFHKIKGTGTTYGIPEVTEVARILEILCMENSDKLGSCVVISIELFQKIYHSHNAQLEFEINDDPLFEKLRHIFKEQQQAS